MIQFVATSSKLAYALKRQSERANLILTVFSGEGLTGMSKAADELTGGLITRRIQQDAFDPQITQCLVIDSDLSVPGLDRIILVGLGARSKLTLSKLRRALTEAFERSRDVARCERLIFPIADIDLRGLTVEQFAEVVAEYATLLDYEINHRKTRQIEYEQPQTHLKSVTVLCSQWSLAASKRGLKLGQQIAEATNRARDMVNEPSDEMTPQKLAEIASQIAAASGGSISCKILNKQQITRLGMQGVLAVNQGSVDGAVLIDMTYTPGEKASDEVIALVGKGITFDSGGLGIKDGAGMQEMKNDMGGAAAVLCTMSLLPAIKPKITVRAVVAATDNLIDAKSCRPGNILTMMSGLTVEIGHTDAEGRLTLADALHYAQTKCGATKVIDLATLTGAVEDALGDYVTGIFGNDPSFTRKFLQAARLAGEEMHELPLPEEYRDDNYSAMADLTNDGVGPGAIAAAWFLREFIQDGVSWVHADIAATSYRQTARGVDPEKATGVGVRTLTRLLAEYA
jgi:leucyl aminopeptidase